MGGTVVVVVVEVVFVVATLFGKLPYSLCIPLTTKLLLLLLLSLTLTLSCSLSSDGDKALVNKVYVVVVGLASANKL